MKKLNLKWVTESIGNDYKKWSPGDVVLISAQTGTGKTWFVTNVLVDHLQNHERLLYVCNRTNLKRQLKSDLLVKYGKKVPENYEELDGITQIHNITITSYQAISSTYLDEIYLDNGTKCDFDLYDYIVADECQYIFSDSGFNNKTRLIYEKLVYEYHPAIIKIFISATNEEIRQPILNCVEKVSQNPFNDPRIFEYSTGTDYSYVHPKYFKRIDPIINLIKNDDTDDKWVIFISNIKRDGQPILEAVGDDNCSLIQSGTKSDELTSIINEGKFNKKVLICTKALDNGINIKDQNLKHIVIMSWDRITFIQMLGRKRVEIHNADEVNIYIPTRYKKSFKCLLQKLEGKEAEVHLLGSNPNEFGRKHDNDLKNFNGMDDVFYRNKDKGEIKINHAGYFRLRKDIAFCQSMIEAFEVEGEYAFIHEQLSWLGLRDPFPESKLIEDIVLNEEIESLEKYLESIIGKQLFKEEQQELINKISLTDGRGRLQKSISLLNEYFKENNMKYIILQKLTSRILDGKKINLRYWVIDNVIYN